MQSTKQNKTSRLLWFCCTIKSFSGLFLFHTINIQCRKKERIRHCSMFIHISFINIVGLCTVICFIMKLCTMVAIVINSMQLENNHSDLLLHTVDKMDSVLVLFLANRSHRLTLTYK